MAIYAWDHWNNNVLLGGDAGEEFLGGDGNDIIIAGVGDDTLRGQADNDILFGDGGEDTVQGGDGNDEITGGGNDDSHDELFGGSGDDTLHYSGEDHYDGDCGFDTFSADGMGYLLRRRQRAGQTAARSKAFASTSSTAWRSGAAAAPLPRISTSTACSASASATPSSSRSSSTTSPRSATISPATTAPTPFWFRRRRHPGRPRRGGRVLRRERTDTVEYGSGSTGTGVNVDLERGTGLIGDAEGDTYSSIENIRGSRQLDALYGNDSANAIFGREGNDYIEGRGGADVLDGGEGEDTVLYTSSPLGVSIDLGRRRQLFGDAASDSLRNMRACHRVGIRRRHRRQQRRQPPRRRRRQRPHRRRLRRRHPDRRRQHRYRQLLKPGSTGTFLSLETIRIVLGEEGHDGTATRTSPIRRPSTTSVVETDTLIGFENVRGSNRGETIIGNSGVNTIEGRGGNDTIDGGRGNDMLNGGDATDTVSFESWDPAAGELVNRLESIRIDLGAVGAQGSATWSLTGIMVVESDTLAGFENVRGSNRAETIIGNAGTNVLQGRGGNDVLQGGAGSDTLDGGAGSDFASYEGNAVGVTVMLGLNGADGQAIEFGLVSGQPTAVSVDTLRSIENVRGSITRDSITGNEQGNILDGRDGADTLTGGGGDDTYLVDNAGETILENGGQGIDTVRTSVSYTLTSGADVELVATTNDAGTAALTLFGNQNGNVVQGNNGNNLIGGGNGNDELIGLGGQDRFLFNTALDGASNVDVLSDFNVADDTIALDAAIFNTLGSGVEAGEFVIGTAALDANDRIIYNSQTGDLLFDRDGVGGATAIQFAEVTPGLALTHLDFMLFL